MGLLKVWIDKATGLKDTDVAGKGDPYCTITVKKGGMMGKSDVGQAKTTVKKDTTNPEWNEGPFLFSMDDIEKIHVYISIKDEDVGKDDSMGSCEVDINDLSGGPLDSTPRALEEVVDGNIFTKDGKLFFRVGWFPDES